MLDTDDAYLVMTTYQKAVEMGHALVIVRKEFWLGPPVEILQKLKEANEDADMFAGPFKCIEDVAAWMDGYEHGREDSGNVVIRPKNAIQGAH